MNRQNTHPTKRKNMLTTAAIATLAIVGFIGSGSALAHAQEAEAATEQVESSQDANAATLSSNTAPVCANATLSLGIPWGVNSTTLSLSSGMFTIHCSDADGDPLTLVMPTLPWSQTIYRDNPPQFQYRVSDGNGGTSAIKVLKISF